MVLRFGTNNPIQILHIIEDVNNNMPWMIAAIKHNSSVYFVKKIYKHFGEFDTEEDIKAKLKNIDIDNNKITIYKYKRPGNYRKHAQYYRDYMKNRRLKERIIRAQKFLEDNKELIVTKMVVKSIQQDIKLITI